MNGERTKMRNLSWLETEIRSAVQAYFALLNAQERGEPSNKTALYKALSNAHPKRSAKFFEFKFQNISAILYEEKLPYVDGLRPMGNYQAMLRTLVIESLKKRKHLAQRPIEILTEKLKRLRLGKLYLETRLIDLATN